MPGRPAQGLAQNAVRTTDSFHSHLVANQRCRPNHANRHSSHRPLRTSFDATWNHGERRRQCTRARIHSVPKRVSDTYLDGIGRTDRPCIGSDLRRRRCSIRPSSFIDFLLQGSFALTRTTPREGSTSSSRSFGRGGDDPTQESSSESFPTSYLSHSRFDPLSHVFGCASRASEEEEGSVDACAKEERERFVRPTLLFFFFPTPVRFDRKRGTSFPTFRKGISTPFFRSKRSIDAHGPPISHPL